MENSKKQLVNSDVFGLIVVMLKVTGAIQNAGEKSKIDYQNHPGAKRIVAQEDGSEDQIARKNYFESMSI